MYKSVDQFSVETLEVGGLSPALEALRLPFGKGSKSIMSPFNFQMMRVSNGETWPLILYGCQVAVDPKDTILIKTLVRRGDDHAKILRGVLVWCKINAPRYFFQELDRYRIGCECLGSNSTMHQQGKGLSEDELVEMKENLPEGTMQKRIWMFSYQTLRRIYYQRKDHRLPQWRKFCQWIETLPFANEFIICNGSNNTDK